MARTAVADREVFEASDGRKTVLAFIFLILLPFLLSVPVMFLKRSLHGFLLDALSAGVLGLFFAGAMIFLLTEVMQSFRTRIAFSGNGLKMRLPRWKGPNPGFKYNHLSVPYDEIEAVETRCEIYKAASVPVLTRVCTVLKKDGERIILGYINEHDEDPDFDYPAIAAKIAERADVPLIDKGCVEAGGQIRLLRSGTPDWDDAAIMTNEEFDTLRQRSHYVVFGLASGLVALTIAGVAYDVYRSGLLSAQF